MAVWLEFIYPADDCNRSLLWNCLSSAIERFLFHRVRNHFLSSSKIILVISVIYFAHAIKYDGCNMTDTKQLLWSFECVRVGSCIGMDANSN